MKGLLFCKIAHHTERQWYRQNVAVGHSIHHVGDNIMNNFEYETLVGKNGKEAAQKAAAGAAGTAAAAVATVAVAEMACGTALCTVAAPVLVPVAAGLAAAAAAAAAVGWLWDEIFD